MRKINEMVLSWDTFVSFIATVLVWQYLPDYVTFGTFIAIYATAISVLSIIFSIFFASLAVIIAFPDNSFIAFIEKSGDYFTQLVSYYKTTLFILFAALFYTLAVYIQGSLNPTETSANQIPFIIFVWIFTYSLGATLSAVIVILELTQSRSKFLKQKDTEFDEDQD